MTGGNEQKRKVTKKMDLVLDLQAMEAPEMDNGGNGGGGGGHPISNLSLLAGCANSTLSLLGCSTI
jgi:Lanthionine-containing peptide SapB precursor RamS